MVTSRFTYILNVVPSAVSCFPAPFFLAVREF
jgi:hypothetical protein